MMRRTANESRFSIGAPDQSPGLLAAAMVLACLIHLILIPAVNFRFPQTKPGGQVTRPLEVMVLRQAAPSDKKPETVDAYAQVDRDGGGVEEAVEAEILLGGEAVPEVAESPPEPDPTASLPPQVPPPLPEPIVPEPSAPEHPLEPLALTDPTSGVESIDPQPPMPAQEPLPERATVEVGAAEILASRNLEIAELTARIHHSSAAYANRQRRKAISTSTREYKYASYLEAWRRKIERVGNLNYPEEAKRHKVYGNLILHVAVRADGGIEQVHVVRSSGFDLLDEAAVKIVELAAPFAPFPPDIRAETDVLDITRTWQFLSSNHLGWEN